MEITAQWQLSHCGPAGAPPAAAVSAGALVFVRESVGRKEESLEMEPKADSFHRG